MVRQVWRGNAVLGKDFATKHFVVLCNLSVDSKTVRVSQRFPYLHDLVVRHLFHALSGAMAAFWPQT